MSQIATGPEVERLIELYTEGRASIERDTSGLTVDALDWAGPDPRGVVTIGSQLVHMAGFDNLVRSALVGVDIAVLAQSDAWIQKFGPGFPRELKLKPPLGNPLEDYLGILREETGLTLSVIRSGEIDWAGTTRFYLDGLEFQPDGLRPHNNAILLHYVPMHDRYHRGQVSQQRYFYSKQGG
jgi:hypothetical protein